MPSRPRAQPVPSLAFGECDLPAAIHRVKRDQDSDASITRNPCGTTTGRPTVFGDEDLPAVMEYLKDARKTAERPRAQPVPSLAFGQRDLPAAIHRVKRDQDSDASITRNPCGTTTGRPTVFGDEDLLAVMEYLKDARKTAETNISIG